MRIFKTGEYSNKRRHSCKKMVLSAGMALSEWDYGFTGYDNCVDITYPSGINAATNHRILKKRIILCIYRKVQQLLILKCLMYGRGQLSA